MNKSVRDENGLKKKECPVCHKEYTDADNKKSLRLYNMCTQCKKNYDKFWYFTTFLKF